MPRPELLFADHHAVFVPVAFMPGIAGKFFRIGHLGDTNDLTIIGALAATEMSLELSGVPFRKGGVQAAMDYLVSAHKQPARAAAE